MCSVKHFKTVSLLVFGIKLFSLFMINVYLFSDFFVSNSFMIFGYTTAWSYAVIDGEISKWVMLIPLFICLAWVALVICLIFCRCVARVACLEAVLYLSEAVLGIIYLVNLVQLGQVLTPIPLIIVSMLTVAYCIIVIIHDRRENLHEKRPVDMVNRINKEDVDLDGSALLECENHSSSKKRGLKNVLFAIFDGLLNSLIALLIILVFLSDLFSEEMFGVHELLLLLIPAAIVSLIVYFFAFRKITKGISPLWIFFEYSVSIAFVRLCIKILPSVFGNAVQYRTFMDYSIVSGFDISCIFLYSVYIISLMVSVVYLFTRKSEKGIT